MEENISVNGACMSPAAESCDNKKLWSFRDRTWEKIKQLFKSHGVADCLTPRAIDYNCNQCGYDERYNRFYTSRTYWGGRYALVINSCIEFIVDLRDADEDLYGSRRIEFDRLNLKELIELVEEVKKDLLAIKDLEEGDEKLLEEALM